MAAFGDAVNSIWDGLAHAWDWQALAQDRGDGITYIQWWLSAWGWTLTVSVLAFVVAMFFGTLMGILRTTPSRFWSAIANIWTELFRNIPLLVQIFLWYHVVPAFFPAFQQINGVILVIFALGFFTSARISEQVKAGIDALPRGQRYAGLAMGLTLTQTYRFILLPRAFRIVIPPLISESMNIVKNSSAVHAVISVELAFFFLQAVEETSKPLMILVVATVPYVVSTVVVNKLIQLVEKRVQIPGLLLGGKS